MMTARAEQEVLFANDAFYRAFAERDFRAMDGVWVGGLWLVHQRPERLIITQ